ncbi:MAG: dihydrolipoamide acetyltransferase family protein [Planctomycetota bacterium]|nr:dihydrolipoamide acetyltransferase family protein [Planctomycetota bacterium]MDA1262108.1 dihydrolipoamide acetyltransferase family protein [Planctomycetota bacterium]
MPVQLTMPRLSDTMEAGTIVRWNVKEGDVVSSGDVVADIETDKATMEMPVYDDGVISKIMVEAGKQVPVGTPIAIITVEGDEAGSAATVAAAPVAVAAMSVPSNNAPAQTAVPAQSASVSPPSVQFDAIRQRVSPLARRMADEMGISVSSIVGSGPGGRVVKQDVLKEAERLKSGGARPMALVHVASPSQSSTAVVPIGAGASEVMLSGMRQAIARRLVESKSNIPHYQVTMRFNMDPLLELRTMLNVQLEPQGIKLSVNDFIVRACALAMTAHPFFNASWAGDRIILHGDVNIGVAISLPMERGGGLVVAVLTQAQRKGLREISTETRALAEKARTRGLGPEDMTGATFTISNLGMFGVDNFTAIINPPNSAILACGAAVEQPVVRNHQLVVGHEMQATLSLDHRVIDGAMASEYLQTVKHNIENPATLLV